MPSIAEGLSAQLRQRLGALCTGSRTHVGQVTLDVPAASLRDAARLLREDGDLAFHQLVDLCGIDYLEYGRAEWETSEEASAGGFSRGVSQNATPESAPGGQRFAVVYHLLSHAHNRRVRLHVAAEDDPPRVDSVTDIWPAAGWFEREAFDLFGILFVGHPDLRRLLTDYGFIGHPFRKDFPLIGEVEMRYDPERRRVVYEPVSIEPRTLVPKVIRHDDRYEPPPEAGPGADPADGTA